VRDVPKEAASGGIARESAGCGGETLMGVLLGIGAFFEKQLAFHNLNIIIGKTAVPNLTNNRPPPNSFPTPFPPLLSFGPFILPLKIISFRRSPYHR
jgi:hypothetical protein